MRTRKVVTEITIETNQILVIKRKQVTRSRCSECASEAEFVRPDFMRTNLVRPNTGNVLVDETWNQQVVEAPPVLLTLARLQMALMRFIAGPCSAQRCLQNDSSAVSAAAANRKARPRG